MNIVLAASEAFPFCKTGGLADVVGALTQDFSRIRGAKVILFLPHYRTIKNASSLRSVPGTFFIPIGARLEPAKISYLKWGNALVFFVDNPKYFDRQELYCTKEGDYPDNDERFIFFNRAVLEACKFIGFRPDIIHAHDWQAGLLPAYLHTVYKTDAFFTRTRSMFTIHNIAYQGYFPRTSFEKAGFWEADFTPQKFEYYDGISFLKTGIVFSDKANTVSPTYAKELLNGKDSFGMEGVLRNKGADFSGIINGIDNAVWDPENDTLLPMGYDYENLRGKEICKAKLQEEMGLPVKADIPLIAMVSRLAHQKGVDLLADVIPQLAGKVQFAIIGKGDNKAEETYSYLTRLFPDTISFKAVVDEGLAHRLYAAADLFIMPSRFEPCGLSQMISMRYGTLPIVSRVGGLADTVTGFDDDRDNATGFFIGQLTIAGVKDAIERALSVYDNKKVFTNLAQNAMLTDFSWENSSRQYTQCFNEIVKRGQKW